LLAVVLPAAVFVVLAIRAAGEAGFAWDGPVVDLLDAIAPVSSDDVHVDPVLTTVTICVGAATAVVCALLLVRRRLRAAVFLAGAIVGAVALSRLVKAIVERPPIEGDPQDYSFPSGNAAWSAATVVALVLLARTPAERRLVALAGGLLLLGVGAVIAWEEWHYPSDVVAGWLLATAWVAALWLALRPRGNRT
jgi:undecaprenyl-diphosphatase